MKNNKILCFFLMLIIAAAFCGMAAYAETYENKDMNISFEFNKAWIVKKADDSFLFQNPSNTFEFVTVTYVDLGQDISPDIVSDTEFLSLLDDVYSLDNMKEILIKSNPGADIRATQNYRTHSRETYNGQKYFRYEKVVTFRATGYEDQKVYFISYLTIADGKLYEFHYERPSGVNHYSDFLNILNTVSLKNNKIRIKVNGERIYPDSDPVIIDGRTLVPIRAVAEKLDYTVGWDGEKQLVTLTSKDGKTTLHFVIGIYEGAKNYEDPIPLDVPATIFANRTYLPLRAVAEAMDAEVDWDDETRTVIIKK